MTHFCLQLTPSLTVALSATNIQVLISLLVSALMTGSKAHSFITIPRLIYRREELSRIIAQFERMDRKMQDLQGQNQLKHGCEEDSSSHC